MRKKLWIVAVGIAVAALLVFMGGVAGRAYFPVIKERLITDSNLAPVVRAVALEHADLSGPLRVLGSVDGDSVRLCSRSGKGYTVRFLGIDTPESVHPTKPEQCFGKQASARVAALVSGKPVRLEFDEAMGMREKYGRLLAYVYLPDGTMLNRQLIQEGLADENTYSRKPYKYQREFKDLQETASRRGMGKWAAGACAHFRPTPAMKPRRSYEKCSPVDDDDSDPEPE